MLCILTEVWCNGRGMVCDDRNDVGSVVTDNDVCCVKMEG